MDQPPCLLQKTYVFERDLLYDLKSYGNNTSHNNTLVQYCFSNTGIVITLRNRAISWNYGGVVPGGREILACQVVMTVLSNQKNPHYCYLCYRIITATFTCATLEE